jgi:hypothetical protein
MWDNHNGIIHHTTLKILKRCYESIHLHNFEPLGNNAFTYANTDLRFGNLNEKKEYHVH